MPSPSAEGRLPFSDEEMIEKASQMIEDNYSGASVARIDAAAAGFAAVPDVVVVHWWSEVEES